MISRLCFIFSLFSERPLHFFPYGTPSSPLSSLLTPHLSPVGSFFSQPSSLGLEGSQVSSLILIVTFASSLLHTTFSCILSDFTNPCYLLLTPWPYFVCNFSRSWFTITLSNTVLTLGDSVYISMTLPIPKPFSLLNFCPPVIFPSPQPIVVITHDCSPSIISIFCILLSFQVIPLLDLSYPLTQ